MSQIGQATPSSLSEGSPVTSLTLLVLLLIPCVVLLIVLNCLFLGYKLLLLSKKRKRDYTEEMLLQSTLSTRHMVTTTRVSSGDAPGCFTPRNHDNMKRNNNYVCMSEPILHHPVVTSSRTSSCSRERERGATVDQRIRFLRPDGATGSECLFIAPSTILGSSSSSPRCPCRSELPPRRPRLHGQRTPGGWCRSAPVLPQQSSESEVDTRPNLVPPNSPEVHDPLSRVAPDVGHVRRSSTLEMLKEVNYENPAEHLLFDKVDFVCEYISSIPGPEPSYLNSSAVGPGLDSDFGASAGVSLRILSADSDGLSNHGVVSSAPLAWDYYDPCYVRQNNIPKHKHHRPAIHTKQYWV